MARPDTDDGWLRYAHELDAALACADFTKGARVVLREVFEQIFGPAGLKVARLSPTEIGHRVGKPRQQIDRAIRELVRAGALSGDRLNGYRFHKDYETWTDGGRPRFTPEEIAWIATAAGRAVAHKYRNPPANADDCVSPKLMTNQRSPVINPDDDHPQADSDMSPELMTNVINPGDNLSPKLMTGIDATPETATVSADSKKEEGRIRVVVDVDDAGGREESPTIPMRPQVAAPEPTRTGGRKYTRPVVNDPDEVKRVAAWAEAIPDRRGNPSMEELGSKVYQFATSYPVDWMEDAILCGITNGEPGRVWQYANGCLRRWWAKDGPDHREIEDARGKSSSPARMTGTAPHNPRRPSEGMSNEEAVAEMRRRREARAAAGGGRP